MSGLLVVLCCFVLCRVHLTLKAMGSYGGEASLGICVYIVRSDRGDVSHKDYSFTEYEFDGYIPTEYIHVVCSHETEDWPGIFLFSIFQLSIMHSDCPPNFA